MNPKDCRIPPFIADMEGKSYTFQVRVTAFNFTEHHKRFTITHIAEELGRAVDDNVSIMCIILDHLHLVVYICVYD